MHFRTNSHDVNQESIFVMIIVKSKTKKGSKFQYSYDLDFVVRTLVNSSSFGLFLHLYRVDLGIIVPITPVFFIHMVA